jgi:NADH-quinone oxidoreductase subunit M
MLTLSSPYLSLGIAVMLAGSILLRGVFQSSRVLAASAALLAAICFLMAHRVAGAVQVDGPGAARLSLDALSGVPLVFHELLVFAAVVASPARDVQGSHAGNLLLIGAGTSLALAGSGWVVVLGWLLSSVPFLWAGWRGSEVTRQTHVSLIGSVVALALAVTMGFGSGGPAGAPAAVLVALAVALRKGIFPLHGGIVQMFDRSSLLPAVVYFNGHAGALLTARLHGGDSGVVLSALGSAALVSAVLTSVRALVERRPRRVLGMIAVSQASFILTGLAVGNEAGRSGAMLHWLVVSAATFGMAVVLRGVEARVADAREPVGPLGLAVHAPRLAVFFLICGLALVGLPGTAGYCAEDLLFHGALESHPWLGVALPLATALNAITILRLFGLIFLGVLPRHVPAVPDALPREGWILAACAVLLVAGGLLPGLFLPAVAPASKPSPHATGH